MKLTPSDKMPLLARAAARLSNDPMFMAHVLQQSAEGSFDVSRLAQTLSTDEHSVVRLALCKRPRRDPEMFAADVQRIATESGVGASMIAHLVRRVDALEVFRRGKPASMLAAARDTIDANDSESSDES